MHGPGEPDIDGTEIIARAAEIATRLTARGAAAEKAGRLPQETIDEVVAAGILRLSVPRRYGGLELPYPVVPQISRMLGRGCLATSWTIGIMLDHNVQMGFWPERAQDEFWAQGPSMFAPGFIIPAGTARRVEGGYRLTGQWRMASGYPHGAWILLSAFEETATGRGVALRFALPIADTAPVDNWSVAGLAATGTWDCRLDDVLVPAHRQLPAGPMLNAEGPGTAVNKGPLWRIPLISFYYPNLCAMMLGAAEGVAALVTAKTKDRVLAYGGARAAELGYVQARIGAAQAKLNAAAALLDVVSDRIWSTAVDGRPFTLTDRTAVRANCTWIARHCRDVACDLVEFSGTGSFMLAQPLQRFHREICVLASHAFYDWDRAAGTYGNVLLGRPPAADELY